MKTESGKREADKAEKKIGKAFDIADKKAIQAFRDATNSEEKRIFQGGINSNAQQAYCEATVEGFEAFLEGNDEAKLRWEQFVSLHFEILKTALTNNQSAYIEDLSEVRADWQVCPNCGLSATRYQYWCDDEECNTNLLTGERR